MKVPILALFDAGDQEYYASPSEEFAYRFQVKVFRDLCPSCNLSSFLSLVFDSEYSRGLLTDIQEYILEAELSDLAPRALKRYFEVLGGWEKTP
jgi:hypothetical protein